MSLNAQTCPTYSRLVLPSVRPDAMGMEYRRPDCPPLPPAPDDETDDRPEPYTPREEVGGFTNLWRSLDDACKALRSNTIDGNNQALGSMAVALSQCLVYVEDLQRRVYALDGRAAAVHVSEWLPSDGGHLDPQVAPLDPTGLL